MINPTILMNHRQTIIIGDCFFDELVLTAWSKGADRKISVILKSSRTHFVLRVKDSVRIILGDNFQSD